MTRILFTCSFESGGHFSLTGLALTPTIESVFEGILLVNHFSRVRIVIVLSPGHPLSEVESESGFMQRIVNM